MGLIDDNTSGQAGIATALWSRRAVRDLNRLETGNRMAIRAVGKYLKRWGGYMANRPARRARKLDPQEVRRWLEENYPALKNAGPGRGRRDQLV